MFCLYKKTGIKCVNLSMSHPPNEWTEINIIFLAVYVEQKELRLLHAKIDGTNN